MKKATFLKQYTATPNNLIDDTIMHYTSKIVYQAMALCQRKSGLVKLTIDEMVLLTGLCETTVLQALRELSERGYIRKKRSWFFSPALGRVVFASNTYRLRRTCSMGYTLISVKIMSLKITPAAFCVLLFTYRCAGRTGRAFPSIRYIAGRWKEKTGRGLDMAVSSIQRALKQLRQLQGLVAQNCTKRRGDKSCNSYYMTDMIPSHVPAKKAAEVSLDVSVPIFGGASHNNKITKGLYQQEEEIGIDDFNKNPLNWLFKAPFWFDGTGVRIFAWDAPDDLAS